MSKHVFFLAAITCMNLVHLQAQNWVNGGNTFSANGTLGTNSNHSLLFETNATERGRITNGGNWAIGSTGTTSRFTVNSVAGASPFRAQVNGTTKLLVNANGSLSIGSSTAGPTNGLYVAGNVGIGTATPGYPLTILNPNAMYGINVTNNFTGNIDRIAVFGYSVNNPGWGVGVQGTGGWTGVEGLGRGSSSTIGVTGVYAHSQGNAGSGATIYGVNSIAYGGSKAYGVYGIASGASSFNAAGYFDGNVYANGVLLTSDRKFKKDIAPVEHGLEHLLKLKPAVYEFKQDEYKGMHLAKGRQMGLIADEVKEVFPELVQQAVHPAQYDRQDRMKIISPEVEYEAVNYQGLIPVLVASVQELKKENDQQTEVIKKQQQQIDELKALVNKLANSGSTNALLSSASLSAAHPNPVKATTAIQYTIPEGSTRAQLLITDALGRQIKTIQLTKSGTVNVNVSSLAAGVYHYSLVVDSKTVHTKKLTVVR